MDLKIEPRLRYAAAGVLVLVALAVLYIGQPDSAEKWSQIAPSKEAPWQAGKFRSSRVSCWPAWLMTA